MAFLPTIGGPDENLVYISCMTHDVGRSHRAQLKRRTRPSGSFIFILCIHDTLYTYARPIYLKHAASYFELKVRDDLNAVALALRYPSPTVVLCTALQVPLSERGKSGRTDHRPKQTNSKSCEKRKCAHNSLELVMFPFGYTQSSQEVTSHSLAGKCRVELKFSDLTSEGQ